MLFLALLCSLPWISTTSRELNDHEKGMLTALKKVVSGTTRRAFTTCNLALFTDEVDYETARSRCEEITENGSLATIDSRFMSLELALLIRMAFPEVVGPWAQEMFVWAGLQRTGNEGRGNEFREEDWEWGDGTHPQNYTNWADYRSREGETKLRIDFLGGWSTSDGSAKYPFVCNFNTKYVISDTAESWSGAKSLCADSGLTLAKVKNPTDIKQFQSSLYYYMAEENRNLSPGLWDADNWFWLDGSYDEDEDHWVWLDGEKFGDWEDDMPWLENQPDQAVKHRRMKSAQDSLAISKWGTFDDSYDSPMRKRLFVCQCPDHWLRHRDEM